MKKVRAGGAVDYYIGQVRSGMADYYLAETGRTTPGRSEGLYAPGSAWWGGGASELGLSGAVGDDTFVALFDRAEHPDGSGRHVGRRFRRPAAAGALAEAAAAAADGVDDPYRRWMAKHELKRKGPQASVAAWDCTFSPVKSVSILWAAGGLHVQEQVWAAHQTAVDAGLDYLQEHAAFVRAGRNGVRVLDTSGLVVARFNEWTSRSGDMQIHTHCLLLNRAMTRTDGKWRALDGRAVLAAKAGAGALYNRTLEAELTRRLGVAWRDRPDGLREIDGIDDDLIGVFSTRRRAITDRVDRLVDAYEAKYGVTPSPMVQWRMAQDATLATRPSKKDLSAADALDKWEATAIAQGRRLTGLADSVTGRNRRRPGSAAAETPQDLLARLADIQRATFSRHDLLRAAMDVVHPADHDPGQLRRRAEQLVAATVADPKLVQVSAPDVVEVPDGLCRSDGSSVYDRPGRDRWALTHTIDAEAWLLQAASEVGAPTVAAETLQSAAASHGLGDDQRQAVAALLGDDGRVSQLVGPAGAGKTRALRAAVDAWQAGGGDVVGLTVSQAAANVLAAEANVPAANTAKWLHETTTGRWSMPDGALVLVDEASMIATDQLVAIVDQARRTNSRVVLVGDPAQLAAVHVGGAFDLLADRHGAVRLTEVRRFTADWEATASLQLRARNPACLAAYAMRGRIHSGTSTQIEADLFAAWHADAASTSVGRRRTVLMVVTTNEQAAVLNERARGALLDAGVVNRSGTTVVLRDNDASVGDHIVTRRNRRSLTTSNGGWVVNGDVWTILHVHRNGAADVLRHGDAAAVTLPADYLAEHAHLGYATTAHRAQGMTVDVSHALATAGDTHEQLYVAATRGRNANHIWVATDTERDQIRDHQDLPTAEQILSSILRRRDPNRLAAHQTIADSQHDSTSLARLGAIYEDACRRATRQWAATTLTRHGIDPTGDPQWPALLAKLRQLALDGHDQQQLLARVAEAPLDNVQSVAGVLHWRLNDATSAAAPVLPRGLGAAIPPIDNDDTALARQAVGLMRHRWHQLRQQLTYGATPGWVGTLGPRPADPEILDSWLTAATAAAAYRERYELADHIDLIGPRPARSRPDARAAHHHAQQHIDRHLALALHQLDSDQLDRLERNQQHILDTMPTFEPERLDRAHRTHDSLERQQRISTDPADKAHLQRPLADAQRDVARLEHVASEHGRWRRAAARATDTLRQIRLAKQQLVAKPPVRTARRR